MLLLRGKWEETRKNCLIFFLVWFLFSVQKSLYLGVTKASKLFWQITVERNAKNVESPFLMFYFWANTQTKQLTLISWNDETENLCSCLTRIYLALPTFSTRLFGIRLITNQPPLFQTFHLPENTIFLNFILR